MITKLLATAAVVALATSTAFAQSQPAPATPATPAPTVQTPQPTAPVVTEVSTDSLASKLIGQTVYNSDASDAQTIGAISDLVVGADGQIKSAVIGVGGFLGIGKKDVAVDFSTIKWSVDQNGKQWAVLATTKEQLQAAPAFDSASVEPQRAGDTNTAANSNTTTTAAPAPAPAPTTASPAPDTLTAVEPNQITAKDLDNVVVYSGDNQNVGEISDVVVDASGKVDAVIVDVGGFLGVGEKPVAIGFNGLDIRKDQNNNVYAYTKLSKAQLDAATQYDKNSYEANRDKMRIVPQT